MSSADALKALRSEVGLVRWHAVRELAQEGDPTTIDELMSLAARDVEQRVRQEAVKAVEAIKTRSGAVARAHTEHLASPVSGVRAPLPKTQRLHPSVLPDPEDLTETRELPPPDPAAAPATAGISPAPAPAPAPAPPPGAAGTAPTAATKRAALAATVARAALRADDPSASGRRTAVENATALEAARRRTPEQAARERKHLLDEALVGIEADVLEKRYGWKLQVHLLDGRKQQVRVSYEQSDVDQDKVIAVHSACGEAKPKHYRWALALNYRLSYEKLGIYPGKDGDLFVVSATLLEATADPAELRKAILAVAEKADRIERMFGPEDRY